MGYISVIVQFIAMKNTLLAPRRFSAFNEPKFVDISAVVLEICTFFWNLDEFSDILQISNFLVQAVHAFLNR